MLVCLCHPLTDRQLGELVDDGADTVEEIGRRCGAGTSCGACVEDLAEAINEKAMAAGGLDAAGRSLCSRLGARGHASVAPRCSASLVSVRSRARDAA
ncbi:MAG: (2Fe-2S)-binding protein [Kofleriaceae bacterium]